MRKCFFIFFFDGNFFWWENIFYFENVQGRKFFVVEGIYDIYVYGYVNISLQVFYFLVQKGIFVYFFNYYGYYDGLFYLWESFFLGDLIIKQVKYYFD